MKKPLMAIFLWLAANGAWAQTLSPGLSIGGMSANRDMATGASTIAAQVVNTGDKALAGLSVTFNLYDESNHLIGTAKDTRSGLAPGETWAVQARTPLSFSRFSAMEVVAH